MASIINIDGETIVFTEGDPTKRVDADGDALLTGVDDGDLDGAVLTISITANKEWQEDLLGIDYESGVMLEESFIEGSAVYVDGRYIGYIGQEGGAPGEAIVFVFQSDATADDVSRVIRAVTYTNIDQAEPSPLTRTLTFSLALPGGTSASANVHIDVIPVQDFNHPPVVDLDTTTAGVSAIASYSEQAPAVVLVPNASVVDPDTFKINGGSLVISVANATANDQIMIQNQGYGYQQIAIEGGVSGPGFTGGGVTIGPDGQPSGVLSDGGIVFATFSGGKNGTPMTVTFLPEQSVADAPATSLQPLYRAITYSNTSDAPPAQRTITFRVDDGDGTAYGGNPIATNTVTLNITGVNDAPVVDLNGAGAGTDVTLAYTENGAAARIAPAATVTDDNPAKFNGGSLTIAFAGGGLATDQLTIGQGGADQIGVEWGIGGVNSDSGAITLGGSILSTFQGGKNGAPLVINFFPEGSVAGFTTLETVQAILRCISYSSTADNPVATKTITYTLKDGQGTAGGGQDTSVTTATVNITAVEDVPIAVADTLSIVAGQVTQYNVSQLVANDRDPDGDTFSVTSVTNIAGGTAALANGIVTFTPTSGAPSFRYTITDSTGKTASAVVTLNRAPVAVTDSLAAVKDQPVVFTPYNLTRNDTDAESNTLTITSVLNASHGTVVLNANGTITFTPEASYTGAASFQYTITDGFGTTTGTANVNVRATNANPVATNDTVTTNEDVALNVPTSILTNDSDSDGGFLTVLSVSNATGGTAVLQNNGVVRFTPTLNFNGEAGFDYVLSDSQGGTASAHVKVNVTPVNDPPVANVNTLTTLEDKPLVISWDTLLANDVDVDGDTLTITLVNTAVNGSVVNNTFDRTVTFTPAADYSLGRAFSFRYTISDGKATSTAQVNVNVTPVNDGPSGVDNKVGLDSALQHVFTVAEFATGFSDARDLAPFNAGLNSFAGVVITTLPGSGTIYFDADGAGGNDPVAVTAGFSVSAADLAAGKLSYTGDPAAIVNPTFTFQVRDDGGTDNGGVDLDPTPNKMELAITFANDEPVLDLNGAGLGKEVSAAYSIGSSGVRVAPAATLIDDNPSFAGGSLVVGVMGFSFGDNLFISEDAPGLMVLGNQIYYGDVLVARINQQGGTQLEVLFLAPATAESVQAIVRAVAYDGTNVFDTEPRQLEFALTDGAGSEFGGVDTTRVLATVTFNNPPIADTSITFAGTEDQAKTILTSTLLANASDLDGDAVSVSAVYGNPDLVAALSPDGTTITLTPRANFNGATTFSYDLRDAQGGITHVTVNGTIAGTPDDPIARTDTLSAQQGTTSVFQAAQLLNNDSDPDGPTTLQLTGVTSGAGGTVVLNQDGTVSFTPDGSRLGLVSFTYTVADNNGGSSTGTANVTIKKLLGASEDVTVTYTVEDLLGTSVDANGLPIVIDSVAAVSGGTVVLNGNGTVSFTSQLNFNGRANFDFVAHDGAGNSFAGGALVDIAAVPDNPIVYSVQLLAPKGQSYTYSAAALLGQSVDPDGTPLKIGAVSGATHGTAVVNADGSVTFTAAAGYEGSAGFTFTVTDGNGGSTDATAQLTVLRALTGSEDEESVFTLAEIAGPGTLTNFNLGFEFTGGFFYKSDSTHVTFTPDENFDGLASVDYTVRINNVLTSGRIIVNVTPVNDAPFGQSRTATISEDVTHVFSVADFPITDVEKHALDAVVITSIPLSGKLWLDSDGAGGADPVAVTIGTVVSRDDIAAGKLTYVPAANANGNGAASFTFKVRDTGGTGNNGQDTSANSSTFTFNITAVNDAPVMKLDGPAADSQVTLVEGASVAIAPQAVVTDLDSADFAGGKLVVAVDAAVDEDLLTIAESSDANGIHLANGEVRLDGVLLGTWSGGTEGEDLVIEFGVNATPARVQALLAAIRYQTTDDTPPASRTVTAVLTDGDGGQSGQVVSTVTIQPTDDAVAPAGDTAQVMENGTVSFAPLTNDVDPDGGAAETIVEIDGTAIDIGETVTLASGAKVTLNEDGTLTYNPNGKFGWLVSPEKAAATGASNGEAVESFVYTLSGGGTASIAVTVTGIDSPLDRVVGTDGDDAITGTDAGDVVMLSQGGSDHAEGGDGDDGFYMGGAWDAGDELIGGAGQQDQIGLQGNTNVVLGENSMTGIEQIVFLSGANTKFGDLSGAFYSYNVTTHEANVERDQLMVVQANALRVGETLTFDGRAETDGAFLFYGGYGTDILTGSQNDDGFFFGSSRFGSSDKIDGQGGSVDQLGLQADYTGSRAIVFGADQLTNIEMIVLLSGADSRFNAGGSLFGYTLTMHDDNALADTIMTIQANKLRAGEVLTLDASDEHDAIYHVFGGASHDIIIGGDRGDVIWSRTGNDTITGGGGADELHGGVGDDVFVYLSLGDSTAVARDRIFDFTAGDAIDLSAIGIDSFAAGGFTHTAGEATARYGGSFWLIEGDVDGDGVADLSIRVDQAAGYAWSADDFVLALGSEDLLGAGGDELARVLSSSLYSEGSAPTVNDGGELPPPALLLADPGLLHHLP